jgi:hypothetical protein
MNFNLDIKADKVVKHLSKSGSLKTWTFIVIIGIWGTSLITHAAPILEQVVKILEIMIKPSL